MKGQRGLMVFCTAVAVASARYGVTGVAVLFAVLAAGFAALLWAERWERRRYERLRREGKVREPVVIQLVWGERR